MTGEGCVRIVIFIFIGAGGLVLGCCYMGHYSEYAFSLGQLLARGRCGVSGAQVVHWPPFASGYYVSCMYYDHIVHVKHACFDCCPDWAAMRHLICVLQNTHIYVF